MREPVLKAFSNLRVWKRNGRQAPHKPLLILYALGKWAAGEKEGIYYKDAEEELKQLLRDFGMPGSTPRPDHPFWRLSHDQTDGLRIWEVGDGEVLKKDSKRPAKITELRQRNIRGRFTPEICRALDGDPTIMLQIVMPLLDAHFPESMHEDILGAVGLSLSEMQNVQPLKRKRDPKFRKRVIKAYEGRCAVCRTGLLLSGTAVALDAAHIMWHSAGGPDIEPNGLALCPTHHKVFDRGAFTISKKHIILVSEHARRMDEARDQLLRFHGHSINKPQYPEHLPAEKYLEWHEQEVFRPRARYS